MKGDLQEYQNNQKSLRFSAFTKEKVVYVSLSVTQPANRGFNELGTIRIGYGTASMV